MKTKIRVRVKENIEISKDIFSMRMETSLGEDSKPGQFIGVYTGDRSMLLPRPISICESAADELRIVYRIAGKGTDVISKFSSGDEIDILGLLGNGYDVEKAKDKKNIVLMAGGIGIPPMLGLASSLYKEHKISCVLGYRDSDTFLLEEFKNYCDVYVASDDGSVGVKGNVMDTLHFNKINPDLIFACGPMPMLRAIKQYSAENDIEAYISLEERMACGVGACLGCVCRTVNKDHHSHVNNARICTDGPVFEAGEVDI